MTRIGIMQGRLVPPTGDRIQCFPRDDWEAEFALAAQAGLDCLEWIYDLYGADANPLSTDAGVRRMRSLSTEYGVPVLSLCADYFMEEPLLRANPAALDERLRTLEWLIQRCGEAGMTRLVLPFVDASHIDTESELADVTAVLHRVMAFAGRSSVEIHLETSLPARRFAGLLALLPYPTLRVNYDSGNSASLGYSPGEEFAAYGHRVGSVHIKDRKFAGPSVPLGTGHADLKALFKCLSETGYGGDCILQVARGTPGDEVEWARQNREFVTQHLAGEG